MTKAEEHKSDGIGKDLVVYVCLLALASLQFLIAYQNIDITQKFVRMLAVAIVEAGLVLFLFMHPCGGNQGLIVFLIIPSNFGLPSVAVCRGGRILVALGWLCVKITTSTA